ncbi:MAG TPA: HD domain-containing phosphohydrolase [Bacteroidota bacterium]|nr:HD domain-containing phosphohydrolase [Bacteroidota bacterium]
MSDQTKVLIVDDDDAQRQILLAVLHTEPTYEVLVAEDGAQGLRLAQEQRPTIIISDIYMPVMDGVELCSKVKSDSKLRETMFILLTGSSDVKDKVRGFDSGADDYVTRPVHADELLSRVRASLRIRAMHDEMVEDRKALAELNHNLEESYTGVLQLMTHLIGLRVPNASARAERAEQMAIWIGSKLEMNSADMLSLGTAARLHEIGKISFPDGLLRKDAPELSEDEKNEIGSFPSLGQLILKGIPKLKDPSTLIRHQLENYDGSGYPDRLMNQQIPIGSRILRLVNLIEQLPVAKGFTQADQLEAVRRAKGTALDPRIVQLAEEYIEIVENPAWMEGKRQVNILELHAGMVLAHDLVTGTGTKLLPKDSVIGTTHIEKILAHHHFDPIVNSIYVYSSSTKVS